MSADENAGTVVLSLVAQTLPPIGVSLNAVLQRSGLSPTLVEPGARAPAAAEHVFWTAIEREARDPAAGLRIGERYVEDGLPSIEGYLSRHSATLRSALENTDRFARLNDDRARVFVHETGDLATVSISREGAPDRAHGFVEMLFHIMTLFATRFIEGFILHSVELKRAKPRSLAPYLRAFGHAPRFAAPRSALAFSRDFLDLPVRGAESELGRILLQHATALAERVRCEDPLLRKLHALLAETLASPTPLVAIAKSLGMSERSLRRYLAARGTGFQQELDRVRRQRACDMLAQGLSVSLAAQSVGFRSTSAFQKAFTRWTQQTPSSYRGNILSASLGDGGGDSRG